MQTQLLVPGQTQRIGASSGHPKPGAREAGDEGSSDCW
jgi:hypothetical protein